MITTLLILGVQLAKLIVHLKVYTPGINPVIEVVGELGVMMVGVLGPLTNVHSPVPTTGVFPERFILFTAHKDWEGPATAVVGPDKMLMVTSEKLIQAPFVIVQRKT